MKLSRKAGTSSNTLMPQLNSRGGLYRAGHKDVNREHDQNHHRGLPATVAHDPQRHLLRKIDDIDVCVFHRGGIRTS